MTYLPKPKEKEGRVTLTVRDRYEQLQRKIHIQQGLCFYCGCVMTRDGGLKTATRDHYNPQPAGCTKDDSDENIVAACLECNQKKGSQRP